MHEDLVHALHECDYILYLSFLHLLSPITLLTKYVFINKTKRGWSYSELMLTVDIFLFTLVCIWIYDRLYYTHWDEHNLFMEYD